MFFVSTNHLSVKQCDSEPNKGTSIHYEQEHFLLMDIFLDIL